MNRFLSEWKKLDKYVLQEQSLALLFRELCPENTRIEQVLLKVSALNDFYSTNIFNRYAVARHIIDLDIDGRLATHDLRLVNELARVTIAGKKRNFYSFATKYCNHHNADVFPIYDQYVDKMLIHFARTEEFAEFSRADLKTFPRFVGVVSAFRDHYGLGKFTLREIDIYLWLGGKAAFKVTSAG